MWVEDAYKFVNGKLVRNSSNLMGVNDTHFNLTDAQLTEISINAIYEFGLQKEQSKLKLIPKYLYKNGLLTPNYGKNTSERIKTIIKETHAHTKSTQ